MHYWATPGSAWRSAQIAGPGTTVSSSAPSIAVRPDGRADLVAVGPGTLTHYWAMPGSPWRSAEVTTGGETFVAASVFVRPDGQADIAALGSGAAVLYYRATPGSGWQGTRLQ
jgi:hypothetical protein